MPMTNDAIISLEDLITEHEEWKYGHGKATAITRSTLALVSMVASSLLIRMISVSPKRFTTTYHRLLLGMSISDIIYSLGLANFNVLAPSDVGYRVWNARGNAATCDAMGSLIMMGIAAGLSYCCSINLFYLAKIVYNKSDTHIRSKIEPFLHGVPVVLAILGNSIFLVGHNNNSDSTGTCFDSIYDPPHCEGYEDGEIRYGFEIPCGRGRDGLPTFSDALRLASLFIPPIIIGTSMGMIYRNVWKQENRISRYGAGALGTNHNADADIEQNDDIGDSIVESGRNRLARSIQDMKQRIFGQRSPSRNSNAERSNSRAVMHKALAYSTSYFITWIWPIIALILIISGLWEKMPESDQLIYRYFWIILNPLQGFFNLLIFMHPQVMKEKRNQSSSGENEISWCRAFAKAFWYGVTGGKENKNAANNNTDGTDCT